MNDEVEKRAEHRENAPQDQKEIGALEALWAFFSSMKTAIVLLLVLAAASIVGTVIPQSETEAFYTQKFGEKTAGLIAKFGLNDLYHSTGFSVLLLLVGLNLAICSLNRFGLAWRRTFAPRVGATPDQVKAMQRSERFGTNCTVGEAAGRAASTLSSRAYHVSQETAGESVSLHGSKGRIAVWGPYLTHLSILVIFAGAILGNFLGFDDGYVTITEGKEITKYFARKDRKEKDLGFTVKLNKFDIEYVKKQDVHGHVMHAVTGYKSDLEVLEKGKKILGRTIDVNHPLTHKGISFFQSSYGLVGLVLKVAGPNGDITYVPFNIQSQNSEHGQQYVVPMGEDNPREVSLGGKKIGVFVHRLEPDYLEGSEISPSSLPINLGAQVMINDSYSQQGRGPEAWSEPGWVTEKNTLEAKGYTIGLEDYLRYTGLQVSQNPALPIIYLGFTLMILGVFVSFYVTHKTVRVAVSPSKDGAEVIVGASARAELSAFDTDFSRIRDALG